MDDEKIKNNKEEKEEEGISDWEVIEKNNNGNNITEKNKIIENEIKEEKRQIKMGDEKTKLNNINTVKNDDNNKNININIDNKEEQANDEMKEDYCLINIELEQEKNEENEKKEKIEKHLKEEIEENINNINKINIEEPRGEIEDQEPEQLNPEDYLFNDDNTNNIKFNKEYTDNEYDLQSRRLTARNNDDYLMNEKENKDGKNKDILGDYKIEEVDEENNDDDEDDDIFPFKIVGDVRKKGNFFSSFDYRYLEIDSGKGLLKRYYSTKYYPKKPEAIINIKDFKLVRKQKLIKEYYDLEITYYMTNKKGKKWEEIEYYRFRHQECRNKWFDSLIYIWKALIKGKKIQINNNNLSFVDDRLGIIQEIGRGNKQKKKRPKVNFKQFKVLSLLGIGGFGTVFKVRHILTDKIYAMKVMNKNYIIEKKYLHYVVSELEIMKTLSGFPFILDLHYCFQTANFLYLIIDYCPNGDFAKLEKVNNPRLFFAEVILAFQYIHEKNIVYRDLKPENILLDETGHIKICDFNLAKAGMTKHKRADSFCGSPIYFSPEMVNQKGVNYKCDIYGIGILMYEIYVGSHAFNARNIPELYEKIKRNEINWNTLKLTGDAKDLIMKLCAKDPLDRISLETAKKHKYFKDIDFNKVLNKEYGRIETFKKDKKSQPKVYDDNIIKMKEREDLERKKFLEQQRLLEEDTTLTVLKGKITLKEMMLDQTRHMKNRVRDFYYVKDEDIDQTGEFQLEIKGNNDISPLIMDKYNEQEGK